MTYTFKKIFLYKIIIFLFFFLIQPSLSDAASLFFEVTQPQYSVGDLGTVDVYLDTDGQTVNTVSGSVKLSNYSGSQIDILDGNSFLLFWIERPNWSVENQSISFSGITPGGFSGSSIFLFSFNLHPENTSPIKLDFENSSVLLHDGQGTLLDVDSVPKTLYVSSVPDPSLRHLPEDREPPEDFTPVVTKEEHLYDNQRVVVFATQDKGSGIASYYIREGIFSRFKEIESPYVLRNQNYTNRLVVRAVDKSGNIRSVVVHPQGGVVMEYVVFGFVGILLVLVIFYIRKRKQKISSL